MLTNFEIIMAALQTKLQTCWATVFQLQTHKQGHL